MKKIDFSRFKSVPYWPALAFDEYTFDKPEYAPALRQNLPAWNLFWAIAARLDTSAQDRPVKLLALSPAQMIVLLRMPGYRYTYNGAGNRWTMAAWMCKHSPEEFMHRFWPAMAAILSIPEEQGHVFSD